jgi:hypothetical protein
MVSQTVKTQHSLRDADHSFSFAVLYIRDLLVLSAILKCYLPFTTMVYLCEFNFIIGKTRYHLTFWSF